MTLIPTIPLFALLSISWYKSFAFLISVNYFSSRYFETKTTYTALLKLNHHHQRGCHQSQYIHCKKVDSQALCTRKCIPTVLSAQRYQDCNRERDRESGQLSSCRSSKINSLNSPNSSISVCNVTERYMKVILTKSRRGHETNIEQACFILLCFLINGRYLYTKEIKDCLMVVEILPKQAPTCPYN